jgi:ribosomal protein S18 acetylase RimI-like enzyme
MASHVAAAGRFLYQVDPLKPEQMDVVVDLFHRILAPLYGPQDSALAKIREGKDRRCYLLYDGKEPVGLLNIRTTLSDEFAGDGLLRSIEIKTLCVIDPEKNNGKGIGSELAKKAIEVANLAQATFLNVTVSEEKPESLEFFQKKGFAIIKAWDGKYKPNIKESLLALRLVNTGQQEKTA